YPLARKLAAVAARRRPAVVVVNGAESEPASGKDAVLLQCVPHLVLDGAAIAAEVVGATDVVLWLHGDQPSAADSALAVRRALAERDVVDPLPVRIELGPSGYLAGESSALVNYLSGGPLRPTL